MKTKRCRKCDFELRLVQLPEVSGEAEGVHATFSDLPCLTCADPAHGKSYPYPDFGTDLIDVVYYSTAVPITHRRGFLRKRHHCFACEAIIEASVTERTRVEGRIALRSLPPFVLILEAPVVTCGSCFASQVYGSSEVEFLVAEAMSKALDRAAVRP